MHRLKPRRAVGPLAAALAILPALGAAVLAADPIVVEPGDTLSAISARHGVSVERLVQLNALEDPDRILVGQRLRLEAEPGPVVTGAATAPVTHVVRRGESLWGIARHYGSSVSAIVDANGIADPSRIFGGQHLIIPGTEAAPAAEPRAADAVAKPAAPVTHVVRRGESLWGIARHYGSSVSAIVDANGIADPSRIFGGQHLIIPGTEAAPAAEPRAADAVAKPAAPITHVVRRGESLWGIARHYGSSVSAIVDANGIADPSRIFGGQRLVIPGTAVPAAADASAPSLPADMAATVAERDGVRRLIVSEARAQGVPVSLALAVAWQESGWRQGVVSHAGAVGIMQLLPSTADWVAASMLGEAVDVDDARDNVRAGIALLRHYLDRYGTESDLVLAAYYQGQAAADRHGVYAMTRPYVASIRALERLFGG